MSWVSIGVGVGGAAIGMLGNQGGGNQPMMPSVANNTTWNQLTPNPAAMPMYGWMSGIGSNMMQTPTPYFPGLTYVPPSSMTTQGLDALQRASNMMGNNAAQTGQMSQHYTRALPEFYKAAGQYRQAVPMFQQAAQFAQQGMPLYEQAAQELKGAIPGMKDVLNTAQGNYDFLSSAADVANNKQVQDMLSALGRQTNQQLSEQWLPQLKGSAVSVGNMGGDRYGIAQGQAVERAANQLQNASASTLLNAYGQGLNAQQAALGQTGNLLGAMQMPGQTLGAAGGMYGLGGQLGAMAGQYQGMAGDMYGRAGSSIGMAGDTAAKAYDLRRQGAMDQALAAGWLGQGGQIAEGYQNQALQDQIGRFNHMFSEPWSRVNNVGNIMANLAPIGVTQGGGMTSGMSPNQGYMSPWQAAMGGASTGLGLYDIWKKYQ